MDVAALLVFGVALFVAAVSPGPAIAAIVARVLGRGSSGALAFTLGLALGDAIWLTLAVIGLAAVAQTFNGVFVAIKWAGVAYLLYLAYKMWTAPVVERDVVTARGGEPSLRLFGAGLTLAMGNPKTVMFYVALMPTILDLTRINMLGYLELLAIDGIVLAVVFTGYVVLAMRARRLFTSARALRRLNRASGTALAGAAAVIAAR